MSGWQCCLTASRGPRRDPRLMWHMCSGCTCDRGEQAYQLVHRLIHIVPAAHKMITPERNAQIIDCEQQSRATNIPVALAQRVQAQLVCDLCRVHGIWQILLVGEHQQHSLAQLVLQARTHRASCMDVMTHVETFAPEYAFFGICNWARHCNRNSSSSRCASCLAFQNHCMVELHHRLAERLAPRSACGAARRVPRRYGRDRCCPPRRSDPVAMPQDVHSLLQMRHTKCATAPDTAHTCVFWK